MSVYVFYALLILNLLTFILFGLDKLKAKRHKWRIPEATLLLMALVGGSIGGYVGMRIWHHKTKHKKFSIGLPLILIFHLACVIYFY